MAGKLCAFIVDGRACRREMMIEKPSWMDRAVEFVCPLGHRSYEMVGRDVKFRIPLNSDILHFSADCSQWPQTNYVSVIYISAEAKICDECVKGSSTPDFARGITASLKSD